MDTGQPAPDEPTRCVLIPNPVKDASYSAFWLQPPQPALYAAFTHVQPASYSGFFVVGP